MIEEMIDEVDKEGKVIATHPKSYLKEKMFLHKVSLVVPKTNSGKLVLGKRAKEKYSYPNIWCCTVGGKAISGEREEETALREMKEEIGFTFPIEKIGSFLYDEDDYKAIFSLFVTKEDISISKFSLNPTEIQYCKDFSISDLQEMIKVEPESFAPTFRFVLNNFISYYSRVNGGIG